MELLLAPVQDERWEMCGVTQAMLPDIHAKICMSMGDAWRRLGFRRQCLPWALFRVVDPTMSVDSIVKTAAAYLHYLIVSR